MKVYILMTLLYCNLCYGCIDNKRDTTPSKYKNRTIVSADTYNKHKLILTDSIKYFIKEKGQAYYPADYDSLTIIIIDTILYSPKIDKAAFFVITKNTNGKLLTKVSKNQYHYNASCFIADVRNGFSFANIFWVRQLNVSNFSDLEETSKRISEMYFTEFALFQNSRGESIYKYNFDDIRFWNGPLWKTEAIREYGVDTIKTQ
jgi:hypothetical protein